MYIYFFLTIEIYGHIQANFIIINSYWRMFLRFSFAKMQHIYHIYSTYISI